MKKIEHFILPEHTNTLYENEAISSISLTKDVAAKINELVAAYNELSKVDLEWKQTQEGAIRKGIVYMKDNLINTLHDLLKIYDNDTIRRLMLETYGGELVRLDEILNNISVIITPQMFGAVGDGVTNDTEAIEKAISALNDGDTLYFPSGRYLMTGKPVVVDKANISFSGSGVILCDYGFRLKASNFKATGIKLESIQYSTECIAFMIDNATIPGASPKYIENFTFKDCHFKNFFYSVYACGGAYDYDGTESAIGYPVRDVVIENCYSSTYENKNAGHFQCIQVENISYINNRTYGGQNASSYNAIKGNGFIRVIGNYDHNNSFASCELENGTGHGIIANNTFNSKIWVDDAFEIVVNANTTEGNIHITVGSNNGDADNVIISNNTCKSIRCEQFSNYLGGVINHITITGNNINGDNTHGIWLHGNAVKKAKVSNNFISGSNTNDIAVQRNEQLECIISGNYCNGKLMLIAGTGGKVYTIDNYGVTPSGTRDSLPANHNERSFNGLKVADSSNTEWRINVSTSGELTTTKY